MTFSEFLQEKNINACALSSQATGINFFSGSNQIATVMTRENTPAPEDLFQWVESRLDYSCKADRQNFLTLTEPRKVTNLESLFAAPASKAKAKA